MILAETANLAQTIDFNLSGLGDQFWYLTVEGLTVGSVYALVALGYTMVYGVLKLINFAHSEVFMYGMFGSYIGLLLLGFTPQGDAYTEGIAMTIIYLLLAGLVAVLVSGLIAIALERVAYRPLRKRGARPLTFLITAIGMSFVLQEIMHFVIPNLTKNMDTPIGGATPQPAIQLVKPEKQFSIGDASVTNVTITIIVAALVLAIATDRLINGTKFGRAIRAVAQDPDAATLMGVSRERVILVTFAIGGVLAGAAALLWTLRQPTGIIYSGGFLLGIKAFSAAVLGGIGNIRGAVLGGLLLGVMENYGGALLGNQWKDVVAFVLLILVLMFRPTGILGEKLVRARA